MKKASGFFLFTLFMALGFLQAQEVIRTSFDGPSIGRSYRVAVYLPLGYSDSEDPYHLVYISTWSWRTFKRSL